MPQLKLVLRNRKGKSGTYPIAIRITKDRKASYLHFGKSIDLEHWDQINQRVKKSHPNSTKLNILLIKKLAEVNDQLLELESGKKDVSSSSILKALKRKPENTFFNLADTYLDNLRLNGKYNRLSAEKPRIERFREFLKGQTITFPEITVPLLNRYAAWLKSTRRITDRTVVNHLIVIRSLFSDAIKAGLVDGKYYPFGKGKVRIQFPESSKLGLNREEVEVLENLDLRNLPSARHALNLWLVSYYFAGMRISDLLRLKWKDLQDGRLHYTMGKNAKTGSLKAPEKALRIIEQYRKDLLIPDTYVFPDLSNDQTDDFDLQRSIKNANHRINEALRIVRAHSGLQKPLTMHIARHTFGNISGDLIPVQMLQKLYRHSSITTTIGYQANFIHKDADEALEAVVGN